MYPDILIAGSTSTATTPLDSAIIMKDISKIKLLIKYGAQQGCRFLEIGNNILRKKINAPKDFNVSTALFDKANLPSEVFEKAKAEIILQRAGHNQYFWEDDSTSVLNRQKLFQILRDFLN